MKGRVDCENMDYKYSRRLVKHTGAGLAYLRANKEDSVSSGEIEHQSVDDEDRDMCQG